MQLSGLNITTFTAKIKLDFVPRTTYGFTWKRLSNKDWACTDRGISADKYDSEITLYKDEATINNFINQINANRANLSTGYYFTISNFNSQEHIFGAELNYSGSLGVTAFMGQRTQGTWKGWELPLTLKCLSPTFVGGNGSLPSFHFLDVGYNADSEYTINKFDSYAMTAGVRNFSYIDHGSDTGSFTGIYSFTNEEMVLLRRFIATNRGTNISMPNLIGVAHPFGRRANPLYVKMTAFEDKGMISLDANNPRWKAQITLSEAR